MKAAPPCDAEISPCSTSRTARPNDRALKASPRHALLSASQRDIERARIITELLELADKTGDHRYRTAARVLEAPPCAGAPLKDSTLTCWPRRWR